MDAKKYDALYEHARTFKCTECGHKQIVVPAVEVIRGLSSFFIFGSDADFCQRCDGPVVDKGETCGKEKEA
jgi:DNA-directed RNA polymerase subunit RPC12/RpoP